MSPTAIHSGIKNLNQLQQDLELQLNDYPVPSTKAARVADNVRSSLGHLRRAAEFLEKAKREALV